jgi:hypothetical protein
MRRIGFFYLYPEETDCEEKRIVFGEPDGGAGDLLDLCGLGKHSGF